MKAAILNFPRDEEGATAIEYGIVAAMMAIVLTSVFATNGTLGNAVHGVFTWISATLGGAAT
ncbi:MAG: Flp family type IVb pilin [Janthinobacterium lividum]